MSKADRNASTPGNAAARPQTLACALVAVVACTVFANSALNEFVFDDRLLIEENRVVQGEAGLHELFLSPYHWGVHEANTGLYRPLTLASFALNHRLGGMNPVGYHLVNILLHALASVLVLRLGARVGLARPAAVAGALVFAVHPVHTEVVANLAGRAELLAAVFFLLALDRHAAAAAAGSRRGWSALAAATLFFLSLASKENAATLVGVALVWDLWFVRPAGVGIRAWWKERWRGIVGRQAWLWGALAAYVGLRLAALGGSFTGPGEVSFIDNPLARVGWISRGLTATVVAGRYIVKLLFPLKLSPDYSYAQVVPVESPGSPSFIVCAALGAAVLAGIAWAVRRHRRVAFLAILTVMTFSIVSNVVVVIGTIMAERLLYLPSVGFCLLVGCVVPLLVRAVGRRGAWAAVTVLLVAASWRTVARNADWRDGYTLFSKAVETSPKSVKVHNNLGTELMKRGRRAEAMREFLRALEIASDYPTARINLAQCLLDEGDAVSAERELRTVLSRWPDYGPALFQLGEVFFRLGRLDESEREFSRLLGFEPDHADAHERLGAVLLEQGDLSGAQAQLREAVRLRPDSVSAHNGLGLLYRRSGDLERAIDQFREAVRLAPDQAPLRNNLGNALRQAGRLEESAAELERALELAPDQPDTLYNLGLTLERAGRLPEAADRFRRSLERQPDNAGAHRGLGRVALAEGDAARAVGHLDEAIRLDEGDEQSYALRAKALFDLRRFTGAERDYRKVLELNSKSVAARNNLGIIYAMRGDLAAARAIWVEALRLAPDSKEIRDNLRRLDAGPAGARRPPESTGGRPTS